MRHGSIDIGTNAVLLLVMESDGQLHELYDTSTITRLGEGLLATGRLTRSAMERTVDALVHYRRVLDGYGVETPDCFGTAALREAANRDEFVEMAWQRAGIRVKVISEYEEAYYTYLSVKDDPLIRGEELLIVDIGGGSTEITTGTRHEFQGYVSLPIGTVKLTERFIRHDPPLAEELAELTGFVRGQVARGASDNRSIVGMAGTVTTLAAMVLGLDAFDKKKVHGMVVSLATLSEWRVRLFAMTVGERKGLPGMEPGREDLIPQGVLLMEEIVAAFGGTQFTVSTAGARYGVLYEALDRPAP
jgi:exopolyphosphatase/guanosine-5'-triphosphate,3'-diphosphate pyrophosphatase